MALLAIVIAAVALQVRAAVAFRLSAPSADDWGWIMSDAAKTALDKGIRSAAASLWLMLSAALWVTP